MSLPLSVVCLPELGCDGRLFAEIESSLPNLHHPKWIFPYSGEPLHSYAARMAKTMPEQKIVLLGFGFGAVLAVEMAQFLDDRLLGIVGVSMPRSPRSVPFEQRRKAARMEFYPDPLVAAGLMVKVQTLADRENLNPKQREDLTDMASRCSIRFLRWASVAFRDWSGPGADSMALDGRFRQIHGLLNDTIPLIEEAEVVVPDGRHFLTYTHPEVIVREVSQAMMPGSLPL